MSWVPRTTNSGLAPGGSANQYYWTSANPGATYNLCLANCTTMSYGRVLENGQAPPVSSMVNAGGWHNYVTNGWTAETYSSYHSRIKPGDIIEWPGHVAVVEYVNESGIAYCSSSLYTGDHGRAQWPPGSGVWDTRTPSIMGSTFTEMWNWFYNNNYGWRVYEYVSETVITNTRMGVQPTYILVNPETPGPGPTPPTPPTPTESLTIDIDPSSYTVTMNGNQDYVDFTFDITISGIPANETVSGGNSYPGLSRVYNTGWTYTDYTVSGTTYRYAYKRQTLRYTREAMGGGVVVRHMYFNITKSTGTISSDTRMYITIRAKTILAVLASRLVRKKRRGRYHATIHL